MVQLSAFFPGLVRPVNRRELATGKEVWIRPYYEFWGTDLHSNAKHVAEIRIPLRLLGEGLSRASTLRLRCILGSTVAGTPPQIDATDWTTVPLARARRKLTR